MGWWWWWWWWVELDYSVSSGPFLNFEIEIGDGPGQFDNLRIYVPEILISMS